MVRYLSCYDFHDANINKALNSGDFSNILLEGISNYLLSKIRKNVFTDP